MHAVEIPQALAAANWVLVQEGKVVADVGSVAPFLNHWTSDFLIK